MKLKDENYLWCRFSCNQILSCKKANLPCGICYLFSPRLWQRKVHSWKCFCCLCRNKVHMIAKGVKGPKPNSDICYAKQHKKGILWSGILNDIVYSAFAHSIFVAFLSRSGKIWSLKDETYLLCSFSLLSNYLLLKS